MPHDHASDADFAPLCMTRPRRPLVTRVKRRLGQHFLFDPALLERIAAATNAGPGDVVLEIGPGPGTLTRALAARGCTVVAIERDPDFLRELHASVPAATIVEGNALAVDWYAVSGHPPPDRYVVVGNIPYNITSPLLARALEAPLPRTIVFLVQDEVARRLAAAPGSRTYGSLSVGVRALADVERLFGVAARAFTPPPTVQSAVVRLTPRAHPLLAPEDVPTFRALTTGLFSFRRKQLGRALRSFVAWDHDRVSRVVAQLGVPTTVRPEVLSPEQFVQLYAILVDEGWPSQ